MTQEDREQTFEISDETIEQQSQEQNQSISIKNSFDYNKEIIKKLAGSILTDPLGKEDFEIQLVKIHSSILRLTDEYFIQKNKLKKLKMKFERMYAEEIEKAKKQPFLFKTQSELDGFVIRTNRITVAQDYLTNQEMIVDYIESILEYLKNKRFDIKTILEIRKTAYI